MTTDAVQDGSSPESMRASPSPDDIIAAFLEQQDDLAMYGQSQEYHSPPVNSFPSPSSDRVFSQSNAYTGATSPRPLPAFQHESPLPSPPVSRPGSPSGRFKTAPRHGRTCSYPKKTGKHGGAQVRRHNTLGGTGPKGHMAQSPMIPRKPEDWEPWKNIIHQLYIVQNHILKDIIVIMENTYHFKATPKMYKNQFVRWNFFKYAIKRRSPRSGTDTCSDPASPESTGEHWMMDHDDDHNKAEEMQTSAAAALCNDCDSPVDAYPSDCLDDDNSPSSVTQDDELFRFCLDTESFSLAQQMIMNDAESKELGARWNKGDYGPDFAQRLEGLYNKVTARAMMEDSIQFMFSEEVLKAVKSIYCGWMGDYYESTQQWSEAIEWKKRGLSMTWNHQYVACSMRLEELMRDHGLFEEAEELRRARMNIGWSSRSGISPVLV
ncbi:Clr5 domain-containing protein [Pseudoneurospora amorphoporcata]|uniref:Clr5 domain-containing protein n=1 Tax=Pseudoneurospora amorphoporcata TaxID=241081 RepID=A0AAN6SB34_9PEZI|nr:Clr5 domain-containing protein [Pseudoneurospora amorphoporcata]